MLEHLEDRRLFAYVPTADVPTGISLWAGVVRIEGMQSHDTATVSMQSGKVHVEIKGWAMTDTEKGPAPLVYINQMADYDPALVSSVSFWGLGGDDGFTNNTSLPSTAYGGSGRDVLIGGLGSDVLRGGDDDDRLEGRAGNDSLYGDAGADTHVGGTGSDYIYAKDGVAGNDVVYGDNENFTGGAGYTDTVVADQAVLTAWNWYKILVRDDVAGSENTTYVDI
jgi:Ca2+-binding RTX toxin-like protein